MAAESNLPELDESQRYAAAALFTLALYRSQDVAWRALCEAEGSTNIWGIPESLEADTFDLEEASRLELPREQWALFWGWDLVGVPDGLLDRVYAHLRVGRGSWLGLKRLAGQCDGGGGRRGKGGEGEGQGEGAAGGAGEGGGSGGGGGCPGPRMSYDLVASLVALLGGEAGAARRTLEQRDRQEAAAAAAAAAEAAAVTAAAEAAGELGPAAAAAAAAEAEAMTAVAAAEQSGPVGPAAAEGSKERLVAGKGQEGREVRRTPSEQGSGGGASPSGTAHQQQQQQQGQAVGDAAAAGAAAAKAGATAGAAGDAAAVSVAAVVAAFRAVTAQQHMPMLENVIRMSAVAGAENSSSGGSSRGGAASSSKGYSEGDKQRFTYLSWPTHEGEFQLQPRVHFYDARARVALREMATWLRVNWQLVVDAEAGAAAAAWVPDEHAALGKTKGWKAKGFKYMAVGAAAVTGGALLAVTGGLAAPVVASGLVAPLMTAVGAGAAAGALTAFIGTTAGAAIMMTGLGAAGAGYAGGRVLRRLGDVKEFGFREIVDGPEFLVPESMSSSITSLSDAAPIATPAAAVGGDLQDPGSAARVAGGVDLDHAAVGARDDSPAGTIRQQQQPAQQEGGDGDGGDGWQWGDQEVGLNLEELLLQGPGEEEKGVLPGDSAAAGDGNGDERRSALGGEPSGSSSGSGRSQFRSQTTRLWRRVSSVSGIGGSKEAPLLPVPLTAKPIGGPRLAVLIGIHGWVQKQEDFITLWGGLEGHDCQRFSLVWESKELIRLSNDLQRMIASQAGQMAANWFAKAYLGAAAIAVLSAVALPMAIVSAFGYLDGIWTIVMDRSQKAGVLLAHVLMSKCHGDRPVTLVGYSMGARVLYYCLKEMADYNATGIVEHAALLGAPVNPGSDTWARIRGVVSGRLVNGYSKSDWVLGVGYRSRSGFLRMAAGLAPVQVPGVENVNLSTIIHGHGDYIKQMTFILQTLGLQA